MNEAAHEVASWRMRHGDIDRHDADVLIAHVLGVSRAQLLAHPDMPISAAHGARLDDLAARWHAGEPMGYLTGHQAFRSLTLAVDPCVLVPRPDTEVLVDLALRRLPEKARILELATGSGAIAIALKLERPDLIVTATDISDDALAVARRNARAHDADIVLIKSDWFEELTTRFDAIVVNPPYVRAGDPHLRNLGHEPLRALVGGSTGLEAIKHIVANAASCLREAGLLLLEHGYDQGADVRALLCAAGFTGVETHHDLGERERASIGRYNPHHG
ncbi:MAG: peptide chain release factor N(5)-glutamine methyltransferase [Pseudomonadales bacterium]|nr:peptide chain release factor N(5)-glutamine methyltransferase [Pseudomonadales bacterium]